MNQYAIDFIKGLLRYDPGSGNFYWLASRGRVASGQRAGRSDGRYVIIKVDGVAYYAHRLAWLYMNGVWPSLEIDHKNRNGIDNRWLNLREATGTQNQGNRGTPRNNTSGVAGVGKHGNRWRAYLKMNGKYTHIGSFSTKDEAAIARASAAASYFGSEFA